MKTLCVVLQFGNYMVKISILMFLSQVPQCSFMEVPALNHWSVSLNLLLYLLLVVLYIDVYMRYPQYIYMFIYKMY